MIVLAGLLIGALLGYIRAARRKGNWLDKVQYMLVHALLFALLGLFATITLEHLL